MEKVIRLFKEGKTLDYGRLQVAVFIRADNAKEVRLTMQGVLIAVKTDKYIKVRIPKKSPISVRSIFGVFFGLTTNELLRFEVEKWIVIETFDDPKNGDKAIFRKDKSDDSIFVLFPEQKHDHYYCVCYTHIGQHSAADYNWCIQSSIPANNIEYSELFFELSEYVGYHLNVRKRR
jgi:hypothetical protein